MRVDLADYLRIVRKRAWLIVLTTVLVTLTVSVISALVPKQYVAESRLFVSSQGGQSTDQLLQGSNFTQQRVKSYAEAMRTPLVLDPVIAELGLTESADDLAEAITASVPLDTVLIDLSVSDGEPDRAAQIANAISEQFRQTVPALENSSQSASPVQVTILRPATAPEDPASPDQRLNALAGLLLGLLLGLGLALLRHHTDTAVRGENDVKALTPTPVIGAIHFAKDARGAPLVVHGDPHSPRAEAFRTLRTNLMFVDATHPATSIVVTSSVPGEGKSTTAANLALTLTEGGSKVCVVEADLRRPRMVQYLGLVEGGGLTNLILGEADLEDVLQPFAGSDLLVLGAGPIPPNPSELLGSSAMGEIVRQLRERFDYVVFDAPPLLPVTDAAVLSKHADGVLVVVGAGVVRRDQLLRTLDLLGNVGADVLGLVLNRVPAKGSDSYTYYRDGYRPDPVEDPAAARSSRRRRRHAASLR